MGVVSSLASVLGISETSTPVTAAISELDPTTGQEKSDSTLVTAAKSLANGVIGSAPSNDNHQAFQYFPENISDSKSPEWSRKFVPGGSHPIVTFINGGERVISFSAVFTQEENTEPSSLAQTFLTGGDFDLQSLVGLNQVRKDTVDIAAAIAYLRKFTYPDYPQGVATPPPFAILYLPNSGIVGTAGGALDSIVGAMIQCDVTYEKFHRNGSARIAVVSLSFVEVVQTGENWGYTGRSDIDTILASQKRAPYKREVIGGQARTGILGALDTLI